MRVEYDADTDMMYITVCDHISGHYPVTTENVSDLVNVDRHKGTTKLHGVEIVDASLAVYNPEDIPDEAMEALKLLKMCTVLVDG